jgi:hypothetical protein
VRDLPYAGKLVPGDVSYRVAEANQFARHTESYLYEDALNQVKAINGYAGAAGRPAEYLKGIAVDLRIRADGHHHEKVCGVVIEGAGEVEPDSRGVIVEDGTCVVTAIGDAAEHPGPTALPCGVKDGNGIRQGIIESRFLIGDGEGDTTECYAETSPVCREILLDAKGAPKASNLAAVNAGSLKRGNETLDGLGHDVKFF